MLIKPQMPDQSLLYEVYFQSLLPVPRYHTHGNTLSWWLAWQHTCLWMEFSGLIPICCQEGKPKPYPQDVRSISAWCLCVSAERGWNQRNADAPMARDEPAPDGAAQPFPWSYGLAAVVESQVGSALACSARSGKQLLGGSWLFFT